MSQSCSINWDGNLCEGLQVTGEVKEGETVLVTAAAGGTGHFGVQIAKLKGCSVVATCGSQAKAQLLKDLGADRVINYHEEVTKHPGPNWHIEACLNTQDDHG